MIQLVEMFMQAMKNQEKEKSNMPFMFGLENKLYGITKISSAKITDAFNQLLMSAWLQ